MGLEFAQDAQGLTVKPKGTVVPLTGIADEKLASGCRVLRIVHDKGWTNDDDPGVVSVGWTRRCNLKGGEFNGDLTVSDTPGDEWRYPFNGSGVVVVAPKEAGAGKIEIEIDGQTRATADLSTVGDRLPQQKVCEVTGLSKGTHVINIINRGPGPVAIDAIVPR